MPKIIKFLKDTPSLHGTEMRTNEHTGLAEPFYPKGSIEILKDVDADGFLENDYAEIPSKAQRQKFASARLKVMEDSGEMQKV